MKRRLITLMTCALPILLAVAASTAPATRLSMLPARVAIAPVETTVGVSSGVPTPPPEERPELRIALVPAPPPGAEARGQRRPRPPAPVPGARRRQTNAPGDELSFPKDLSLGAEAHGGSTASVLDPSAAMNGDVILYTGNWFAAVSVDAGASWRYLDPTTFFPGAAGGFCCEQVVHYSPQSDLFFWALLYIPDGANENTLRIAFASTAEVTSNTWHWLDLTSQLVGLPGKFLDGVDLSAAATQLAVTANSYDSNGAPASTLIARIPYADLADGGTVAFSYFRSDMNATTASNFGFRCAQSCGTRIYWASHNTTSQLRFFFWDDASLNLSFISINVGAWSAADYVSNTPDGKNWLGRADSRILTGALTGNEVWFLWNAGRGGRYALPQPYVEAVRIQKDTFAVLGDPILWNPDTAYAYAALCANSNGEVGVTTCFGGPTTMPGHQVGILTGTVRWGGGVIGSHGPNGNGWGDYLSLRPFAPNGALFVATGYSLQGGGGNINAVPHLVLFGRSGDVQSLRVTAPNGGETWDIGSSQSITWSAANVAGSIRIEISRDGGQSYATLIDSTANDGSESWSVAGPATSQARIRVRGVTNGQLVDASDADFTIRQPGGGIDSPATFALANGGGPAGTQFTLRLSFDPHGAQVSVGIFDLIFDATRLTFVKSTRLALPGAASVDTSAVGGDPGRIRHIIQGGVTAWSAGDIIEVAFRAAAGVAPGSTTPVTLVLRDTASPGVRVTSPDARSNNAAAAGGLVTFDSQLGGTLQVVDQVNFGKVKVRSRRSRLLTITNTHSAEALHVTVSEPTRPFKRVSGSTDATIDPGQSIELTLQFKPKQRGKFTSFLTLTTSDPNRANVQVTLVGKGK